MLPRLSILCLFCLIGCASNTPEYGREIPVSLPDKKPQTWAVAPAINLSGESGVDPLLQSDIVFQQLQQVRGLTVIPVNRVVEVYVAMGIDRVQTEQQAGQVCAALSVDGLVVPTITIYDAYNPPKLGAALQLFSPSQKADAVRFVQSVGMYDAANGSIRDALDIYAEGRYEPKGPLGVKEYLVNMDRYCGFVYHSLIRDLLKKQAGRKN